MQDVRKEKETRENKGAIVVDVVDLQPDVAVSAQAAAAGGPAAESSTGPATTMTPDDQPAASTAQCVVERGGEVVVVPAAHCEVGADLRRLS